MFKSLRSRLLLSYTVIIAAVLVILTFTLLLVSALSTADRGVATLGKLAAVSLGTRRELNRLYDAGITNQDALLEVLVETASAQDTRIFLLRAATLQVVYDTGGKWSGQTFSNMQSLGSAIRTDTNVLASRLRAPDGQIWLLYAQVVPDRHLGGLVLAFAQPEPSAAEFFSDTFLRPLCSAGLVAFLLAVLLAFLISRSVARPLQQLAGAATAIAAGDYEQQIVPAGPTEVQQVSASFNTMATQVKASQQAQRDFVANVSHDLKTPLTSVRGWSQALLDGMINTPEELRQAAGIIHGEAERMTRMVNQLLDLARIESGQLKLNRELLDLGQLLTQVQRNLALPAQQKDVRLSLELQPVPPVWGDADRLMQVFTNLTDNALTHTPAGGRVHISLTPHTDRAVNVIVQDTGPGIPADELSRIFERFYQVDKSRARTAERRGSGLGLSITRELVEAHGGRIEARSELGKGSAFQVRLPTGSPEASTVTRRR